MSNVYLIFSNVLFIVSFQNHFEKTGKSTNDKLDGRTLNISIRGSSSSSVLSAARELNSLQKQQEQKKKRRLTMHGNMVTQRREDGH